MAHNKMSWSFKARFPNSLPDLMVGQAALHGCASQPDLHDAQPTADLLALLTFASSATSFSRS